MERKWGGKVKEKEKEKKGFKVNKLFLQLFYVFYKKKLNR